MTLFIWVEAAFLGSASVSRPNWSTLVNDLREVPYQVKAGDTLSGISQEKLGSKEYWPKLWEVNQNEISNPHLLEPGQIVLFDRRATEKSNRTVANLSEAIPPRKTKGPVEDIPDKLIRPNLKHQHRLRFMELNPQEVVGILTGAFEEKNYLTENDLVYVGIFDKKNTSVGQSLALVKEVTKSEVPPSLRGFLSNWLVQVVGEIQIEGQGDDLMLARITSTQAPVERGVKLARVSALNVWEAEEPAPTQMMSRILLGEDLTDTRLIPGQFAVLEGGKQRGMKTGYVFSIYQDEDPVFKDSSLIEPRSKGELKVVAVMDETSIGYVMHAKEPLAVGDVALSRQIFPKSVQKIESSRKNVQLE